MTPPLSILLRGFKKALLLVLDRTPFGFSETVMAWAQRTARRDCFQSADAKRAAATRKQKKKRPFVHFRTVL